METCRLSVGDFAHHRFGTRVSRLPTRRAVDHIAYTIATGTRTRRLEAVGAELKRRGLEVRETPGSFHIKDPDGFEVADGRKGPMKACSVRPV